MKYIEYPELSRLSKALTHEGPECSVHTRIEAYSCKNVKRDKRLFKSLETAYNDDISHSPPLPSWLALDSEAEMTPFGPMDKHASRKTLYLLIATLNIAFPDHEFSDVKPSHFSKEHSGASVLNALSTTLVSPHRAGERVPRTYSSYPPTSSDFFPSSVPTSSSPLNSTISSPYAPPPIISGTHPSLYRLLDDVVGLSDCEVFSYTPDIDSDPHADYLTDEEDENGSVSDEESSTDEDDATFEFDDYDIDEMEDGYHYVGTSPPASRSVSRSPLSFLHAKNRRAKRRGALLWSSHWFFLNRKIKRILFISIWARSKGMGRSWTEDESAFENKINGERFFGWEGGIGAGARAMGLTSTSPALV
jgi:hypothetical protein